MLPAEVLAALDEPLDENDEDIESDAGSSTSVPKKLTTGSRGATPSGSRRWDRLRARLLRARSRGSPPPPMEPQSAPSFPYVPHDLGDPKEMETPRPPRRSIRSAPPPPNVPHPPLAPRELLPSRLAVPAGGEPKIRPSPPGPPRSRGSVSAVRGARVRAPAADGFVAALRAERSRSPRHPRKDRESRRQRGTVPPRYSTVPPDHADQPSADGLPATPRQLGLARRSDSVPASDSLRGRRGGSRAADLPEELGLGDALQAFAICVRERATGALCIDAPEGVRRILVRDGDVVTAASGLDEESLVAFLGTRGDIPSDVAEQLQGKIPAFGRHAGAALVANGHISQDQLWPVLRAHAEWVLACAIGAERGAASFEVSPPGRLRAEPSVFGGATGSEVLIEVVRRSVSVDNALARLGGGESRLSEGPRWELLSECALPEVEQEWLGRAKNTTLDAAFS